MDILVIEDEILIQQSLKTLLERLGAHVTCTAKGTDAIELIKTRNFDRIVCDLMLQDITGFDIIEESKNKYNSSQISDIFLIMTAYSSEQVLNKAREYGCTVLNKPFENMKEALNIILKRN